ncbi:hypothetical protein BDB01DRAFT_838812 [Pilobolus umbonatus]|nr:hypothetical protein BDB01DRAFT_838812 [Pilobolus umbonatus]
MVTLIAQPYLLGHSLHRNNEFIAVTLSSYKTSVPSNYRLFPTLIRVIEEEALIRCSLSVIQELRQTDISLIYAQMWYQALASLMYLDPSRQLNSEWGELLIFGNPPLRIRYTLGNNSPEEPANFINQVFSNHKLNHRTLHTLNPARSRDLTNEVIRCKIEDRYTRRKKIFLLQTLVLSFQLLDKISHQLYVHKEVPLRDHSGGRPKCSHPLKSVEELTGVVVVIMLGGVISDGLLTFSLVDPVNQVLDVLEN